MKFNFSIDLALFTTIFTIFLFACGYFYYDGLISYYGFNQISLGLSIQDYLLYGWVHGMKGFIFGLIILIIVSLMHSIQQKNLYEVFVKFLLVVFTFFVLAIVNFLFKKPYTLLCSLALYIFNSLINSFLQTPLAYFGAFVRRIGKKIGAYVKPALRDAAVTSEKIHRFDMTENDEKIKSVINDTSLYYFYLVGFYLIFAGFTLYVISIGNDGKHKAEERFNSTSHSRIILKDELLSQWTKDKGYVLSSPISAKIIFCGSEKCLIAIKTSNINYQNGATVLSKNNYLMKMVNVDSYILLL